jgi:hypothetical protein
MYVVTRAGLAITDVDRVPDCYVEPEPPPPEYVLDRFLGDRVRAGTWTVVDGSGITVDVLRAYREWRAATPGREPS